MSYEVKKIRAFIAAEISEECRARVGDLHRRLKALDSGVKWVRPEAMHLTLRFLGNIDPPSVDLLDQAMQEAVKGHAPIDIEVFGWGMFPNAVRPRVLWLGLKKGGDELGRLFGVLEQELELRDFGPADKPFSPHLTIGRIKSSKGVGNVLRIMEERANTSFGCFTINRIVLVRSELNPGGAVYTTLKEKPFSQIG